MLPPTSNELNKDTTPTHRRGTNIAAMRRSYTRPLREILPFAAAAIGAPPLWSPLLDGDSPELAVVVPPLRRSDDQTVYPARKLQQPAVSVKKRVCWRDCCIGDGADVASEATTVTMNSSFSSFASQESATLPTAVDAIPTLPIRSWSPGSQRMNRFRSSFVQDDACHIDKAEEYKGYDDDLENVASLLGDSDVDFDYGDNEAVTTAEATPEQQQRSWRLNMLPTLSDRRQRSILRLSPEIQSMPPLPLTVSPIQLEMDRMRPFVI